MGGILIQMEGLALEVNKFILSNKRRQSEETTQGRLVHLLIEQRKLFFFISCIFSVK